MYHPYSLRKLNIEFQMAVDVGGFRLHVFVVVVAKYWRRDQEALCRWSRVINLAILEMIDRNGGV